MPNLRIVSYLCYFTFVKLAGNVLHDYWMHQGQLLCIFALKLAISLPRSLFPAICIVLHTAENCTFHESNVTDEMKVLYIHKWNSSCICCVSLCRFAFRLMQAMLTRVEKALLSPKPKARLQYIFSKQEGAASFINAADCLFTSWPILYCKCTCQPVHFVPIKYIEAAPVYLY